MTDLLRPALYQLLPARSSPWPRPRSTEHSGSTWSVPVCESGDFLAKDRRIPGSGGAVSLLAVHSSGAYGFTMGSNYNGRPRAAEVLVRGDRLAPWCASARALEDLVRGESLRRTSCRDEGAARFRRVHEDARRRATTSSMLDGVSGELPCPRAPGRAPLRPATSASAADQLLVARKRPSTRTQADFTHADLQRRTVRRWRCAPTASAAFYKFVRDRGLHAAPTRCGVETLWAAWFIRRWAGHVDGRVTRCGWTWVRPVLAPAEIPTTVSDSASRPRAGRARSKWRAAQTTRGSVVVLCVHGQPALRGHTSSTTSDTAPVETLGPLGRVARGLPATRVNVEFVDRSVSRERIRQRTFERGTGETLACGSGACAVAVVSACCETSSSGRVRHRAARRRASRSPGRTTARRSS